jgi:hypothetical protein
MQAIPLLVILFLGGAMVAGMGMEFVEARRTSGSTRVVRMLGAALTILGAVGFFGSAIAAMGGMNWLPSSVELPAGRVEGVVTMPDGHYVVPLEHAGRVQVYDRDWRFLRGWQLDAGGGMFVVDALDGGRIQVVTARIYRKYVFALDGRLLSSGTIDHRDLDEYGRAGRTVVVPTHPLAWIWSGPFASWLAMFGGLALTGFAQTRKRRVAPARPKVA